MSRFLKKVELFPPDSLWDLTGGSAFRTHHAPCADLAIDGEAAWMCTRTSGHTGRHAQGNGLYIQAVWS